MLYWLKNNFLVFQNMYYTVADLEQGHNYNSQSEEAEA